MPAQHLLDGARHQAGVLAQPPVGVGVFQERQDAAGQGAAHGVVAGDHDQEEEHRQLFLGQRPPVVEGRGGDGRHQVVAGVAALVPGEFVRVVEHVAQHRGRTRVDGPPVRVAHHLGVLGVLVADDPVGPLQQQAAVGGGDAEQFGEVGEREVVGDLDRQVAAAALGDRVEQGVGTRGDLLGEALQPAPGEHGGGQPADPAVLGRIHVEDHPPDEVEVVGLGVTDLGGAEPGGVHGGVAQHGADVAVAGDGPVPGAGRPVVHLVLVLPGDGRLVAQPAEARRAGCRG